ncbi:SDR family NAD(P)-dependent oxidoreductase [Streptomyces sp. NRRL S-813]|uniref:SDR family NAD(P)-dependent oxidoreductase n=1 Tax=Streptomyces sp. NRRL S-813 TaxID=1463919 RepID=UPI0004BF7BC2|nr:SDR family NAD(P)-dependent oxidoreductase [Streptomyces sp. NRRL S-813]
MEKNTHSTRRAAVVTGAASGIGAAIADRLAGQGRNLVLTGRDAGRLQATAARLRGTHGVTVLSFPLDLSQAGAPSRLVQWLAQEAVEVDVLVNNAGASLRAPVADGNASQVRALVDLNASAVAELTALLLPEMVARRDGAVVNIASTGAYAPAAYLAAYAASKAFVLSFTQAVWAETRGTGVRVVAVSPGPTRTPMNPGPRRGKRSPESVADTVVSALRRSSPAVVDGRMNALQTFVFGRLLPAWTTARISERALRPSAAGGDRRRSAART